MRTSATPCPVAAVVAAGLLGGVGACLADAWAETPERTIGAVQSPAAERAPAPSIQALVVSRDQSLYAGSFGMGVFRSHDRGASWTAANTDLSDPFILCLAAARDGTFYAGTFRAGVFRSRDGGKRWEPMNAGLKRLEIKALLIGTGSSMRGPVTASIAWQREITAGGSSPKV